MGFLQSFNLSSSILLQLLLAGFLFFFLLLFSPLVFSLLLSQSFLMLFLGSGFCLLNLTLSKLLLECLSLLVLLGILLLFGFKPLLVGELLCGSFLLNLNLCIHLSLFAALVHLLLRPVYSLLERRAANHGTCDVASYLQVLGQPRFELFECAYALANPFYDVLGE